MGLEPTSGIAATCFQDRLLIQPDDFHPPRAVCYRRHIRRSHFKQIPLSPMSKRQCRSCGGWNRTNITTFRASHPTVRRPRIVRNPSDTHATEKFASCGGRNRTCGLTVQSRGFLPAETTPQSEEGRAGLEPAHRCLTSNRSAAELPTRSKECPAGGEPASPVWKTSTSAARSRARCSKRKERESNPQGREARPGSSGMPSPVGLPFRTPEAFHFSITNAYAASHASRRSHSRRCGTAAAAVAGIEPASRRLTAASPYQHRPHRIVQSAQSDLNRRSRAPEARGFPDFPIRRVQERPAGVEPALPPWQGSRLPLHHGRFCWFRVVKDRKSTGWDSNPRCRCTRAVSSPLDDQCFCCPTASGTGGT